MIIGSKNKGDWSEFYVLLYLLGTRDLYTADEKLERVEGLHFPIKQIMRRDEPAEKVDFKLEDEDIVEIYLNDVLIRTMTSNVFSEEAGSLLEEIPHGIGSFDIPRSEALLNDIHLKRLAAAPPNDVADIKMELHDSITGLNQVMGFSIKSYIFAKSE